MAALRRRRVITALVGIVLWVWPIQSKAHAGEVLAQRLAIESKPKIVLIVGTIDCFIQNQNADREPRERAVCRSVYRLERYSFSLVGTDRHADRSPAFTMASPLPRTCGGINGTTYCFDDARAHTAVAERCLNLQEISPPSPAVYQSSRCRREYKDEAAAHRSLSP